ncbi:class I SAM-dependent methyltransferase [Nocardia neocaledoniensis]|uniref:class I SAM-dependent methyltransferase n=2 Tax=Nocardia neocaledoniensis TaxID=236511 RepID=UPI00142D6F6C|nr:class I SAM-dependent methyltransferase [Nocardia neocaledoniensis]
MHDQLDDVTVAVRATESHLKSRDRPPFLYIPKTGDTWPDRIQRVGDAEYKVLGGGIYTPIDATPGEVKQLYEYWILNHRFPYDLQHAWIPTIGHNCADIIKSVGVDLSSGSLLDLASGTGLVSEGVRQRTAIGGLHVCLDLTEAALRSARGKTELAESTFVNGDAVPLPFRTSTFDAVTGSLFVGHIPEKQWPDLFTSIERVLKPEGVFVLVTSPNERLQVEGCLGTAFGALPEVEQFTHRSANAPDGFPLNYHVAVKKPHREAGSSPIEIAGPESVHA